MASDEILARESTDGGSADSGFIDSGFIDSSAPAGAPAADGYSQRGRLWVSNRVVEKVASLAAAGVPEVGAASGHGALRRHGALRHGALRRSRATAGSGRPVATAHVRAGSARLEMTMSVGYPACVRDVVEAVRTKVRADVSALTGVRVAHVDVTVPTLPPHRER